MSSHSMVQSEVAQEESQHAVVEETAIPNFLSSFASLKEVQAIRPVELVYPVKDALSTLPEFHPRLIKKNQDILCVATLVVNFLYIPNKAENPMIGRIASRKARLMSQGQIHRGRIRYEMEQKRGDKHFHFSVNEYSRETAEKALRNAEYNSFVSVVYTGENRPTNLTRIQGGQHAATQDCRGILSENENGEMTPYAQGTTLFPLAWGDFLREDVMRRKEIQRKFTYSTLRPTIDKACEILILQTRTITGTGHPQLQKMLAKYDDVPNSLMTRAVRTHVGHSSCEETSRS
ncbi:hypothetical protein ARMGADRAFT_1035071 [Armillaria gallica]|uniref:Uncharacterized protein n=1 Tax=Armillaria gallica TaxID=47427 RepID=A0A2H3DIA5_ARMGA|nr:hypothetical protein ARMGADRAFT_1035071 [Armillaria gallica]